MQRVVFNSNGRKVIFMFVPEIPDELHVSVRGHEERVIYIKKTPEKRENGRDQCRNPEVMTNIQERR